MQELELTDARCVRQLRGLVGLGDLMAFASFPPACLKAGRLDTDRACGHRQPEPTPGR